MLGYILIFLGVWLAVIFLAFFAFGDVGGLVAIFLPMLAGIIFGSYEVYKGRMDWWGNPKKSIGHTDTSFGANTVSTNEAGSTGSVYFPDVRMQIDDGRYFMRTRVAGVGFRQEAASRCYEGQNLALIRDPENHHDNNAISVFADGEHIGFIPAEINEGFALYLDSGRPLDAVISDIVGGTTDKPFRGIYINLYIPDDLPMEFDEWEG